MVYDICRSTLNINNIINAMFSQKMKWTYLDIINKLNYLNSNMIKYNYSAQW